MANAVNLPGDRLAGLLQDQLAKLRAGNLSIDQLDAFVQHKNPFAFERNEHGHVVITFAGLDLTGAEEISQFETAGYRVSRYAKSCFMSMANDSYDKNHRLVAGQQYKLALVPGKEIPKESDRSTANLRALGTKYGYGKPLGGHIPRIRESVSDKKMEEMGICYIASLHEPIKDSDGDPAMLFVGYGDDNRQVFTYCDVTGLKLGDDGAFAFPVSAC